MRILMVCTPVASHVGAVLSLAWAARAAGHDVLFVGQPDVAHVAASAGFCTEVVGDPFRMMEMLRWGLPDGKRPVHVHDPRATENNLSIWYVHARYHLYRYLDIARSWRPDVIVAEQLEVTGCIIGAVLGVPTVQHRWGIDALSATVREQARVVLEPTCARLGLSDLPEPTAWLDPCPPSLQVPGVVAGWPMRYVPVNGAGAVPAWHRERRAGRRVCVTLGRVTVSLNGLPLVRSVVDAVAGLDDVEALVTLDPCDAARLGPVPPCVRTVAPTPLELFLSSCDAVLHHAGSGSLMTATRFGLPQVALPQLVDQFAVADRLAATGAGIVLDDADDQDDPARVRAALADVLDRAEPAQAADRLAAEMAAMPTPAEVVDRIAALAC